MFVLIGSCRLELTQGDIAKQQVDAIVNAANDRLAGGGGVDGALHAAAGPTLMQETDQNFPDGCSTGNAVPTSAGKLAAKFVFHAVGPIWRGGQSHESDLQGSAYRTCLELAVQHQCDSVAFPAISTGVYRYPKDLAAEIALGAIRDFLLSHQRPKLVRMVLFDGGTYGAFARVLESMLS
jgi:O-acetyl-ADP-ribose deacetylase (regulator of RNase III)